MDHDKTFLRHAALFAKHADFLGAIGALYQSVKDAKRAALDIQPRAGRQRAGSLMGFDGNSPESPRQRAASFMGNSPESPLGQGSPSSPSTDSLPPLNLDEAGKDLKVKMPARRMTQ